MPKPRQREQTGAQRGLRTLRHRIWGLEFRPANPRDGGFLHWLARYYAYGFLVLLAHLAALAAWIYGHYAVEVPLAEATPEAYRRRSAAVTRVVGLDGRVLAEFAAEYRKWVPIEQIPKRLQQAFVAVEDRRFYEHSGIDWRGILRAAWTNLKAGRIVQGGSTITQQVAKTRLGSERTLSRKAREAILALRLERSLTKKDILEIYLNEIFLGHGAYGVAGAAWRYFSKRLDELTLPEMALLAGLAQAPSRYSPIAHPRRALRRRNQVLEAMRQAGYIGREEARVAEAAPLRLQPARSPFLEVAPYYAEEVRRWTVWFLGRKALASGARCPGGGPDSEEAQAECIRRLGRREFYRGGYLVETGADTWMQAAARRHVEELARWMDKRQGWRGPEAYLASEALRADFRKKAANYYGDRPFSGRRLALALVEDVRPRAALVRVGKRSYTLPLAAMRWAARYVASRGVTDRTIRFVWQALMPGDVVWVRPWRPKAGTKPGVPAGWPKDLVALEQTPRLQSALLTFDHESGYVLAMVGGTDYDRSSFNRTTQACRQPGSTFKPIYYSLALDRGWNFDTKVKDVPYSVVDPDTGRKWYVRDFRYNERLRKKFQHLLTTYEVTLEFALVWSKNRASVHIFKAMGAENVVAWARKLGFTTPMIPDDALALGASCTKMDELARAFAIFARNGRWLDLVLVRRLVDRTGRVLVDNTTYFDPHATFGERLRALARHRRARQAISARTAFKTSLLLRRMVQRGHAEVVRQTRLPAAGKTGTSSRTSDTWFVGYTSRWLTAAWLGDDDYERPIGTYDASFTTALPLWARYMLEVSRHVPLREIPWMRPDGTWLHREAGRPQAHGTMPAYVPPFERMRKLQQARQAALHAR